MSDQKINVLLVDDEEALLNSLRRRLQFRDFNVIAVSRGEKALEAAREQTIDVAIVDVKMPGMGGKEVMETLKAEFPWMEVIILTGHGSFDPEEEGIAGKLHACLAKPCDLKTLQQELVEAYRKTVIGRRQIDSQKVDAILKKDTNGSPDSVLQKLKEIDDNNDKRSLETEPEEV